MYPWKYRGPPDSRFSWNPIGLPMTSTGVIAGFGESIVKKYSKCCESSSLPSKVVTTASASKSEVSVSSIRRGMAVRPRRWKDQIGWLSKELAQGCELFSFFSWVELSGGISRNGCSYAMLQSANLFEYQYPPILSLGFFWVFGRAIVVHVEAPLHARFCLTSVTILS